MLLEESPGIEIVTSNLVPFPRENPVARPLRALQGRKDAIEGAIGPIMGAIASLPPEGESAGILQNRLDALIFQLEQVENGIKALSPRASAPFRSEMMAPGWAFILEHSRFVELTCLKHFKLIRKKEDRDERRSMLIERLVTRFYRFQAYVSSNDVKNVEGLACVWIQTQARAVNTAARKQVRWRESVSSVDPLEVPFEFPGGEQPDDLFFDNEDLEIAKQVVSRLFDGASDDEKLCILAHLEGIQPDEIEAEIGMPQTQYRKRLRGLRERALRLCA